MQNQEKKRIVFMYACGFYIFESDTQRVVGACASTVKDMSIYTFEKKFHESWKTGSTNLIYSYQ